MDIFKISNMTGGWFVGDFEPTCYKTSNFEICYKIHKKGEVWDTHYHKVGTEINYLIKGEMKIQNKILKSGDIFILYPFEIADPIFIEDCEIIIIKTPSVKNDKIILKN